MSEEAGVVLSLCMERGAAGNREVWARARDLGTHLHSRKARSLQDWPTDTHVYTGTG